MDKYIRSTQPVLKESQDKYLQEELKKIERALMSIIEEIERIKKANNLL